MASSGPSAFGTGADDNTVGTVAWGTPANALNDNNVYSTTASLVGDGTLSHYLKLTNPSGLSIPAGAAIHGITVTIDRKASHNVSPGPSQRYVSDSVVKLVKGGTVQGNNNALGDIWPTAEATQTYGGVSDLWGSTWVSTDFGATFGVVLSVQAFDAGGVGVTASVDYATVTVEYTTAGTRRVAAMACFIQ